MEEVPTPKHSNHEYWFRAHRYGFGWTPARWEGWVVMLIYVVSIVFTVKAFLHRLNSETYVSSSLLIFLGTLALLTAILIYICYRTGGPWDFRSTERRY